MSVFLTKIRDSPLTHADPRSIYMADLLHPRLGNLQKSLQINFMVEWEWLKMNYEVTKNDSKPLLIIHGEENVHLESFIQSNYPSQGNYMKLYQRHSPFSVTHSMIYKGHLYKGHKENF